MTEGPAEDLEMSVRDREVRSWYNTVHATTSSNDQDLEDFDHRGSLDLIRKMDGERHVTLNEDAVPPEDGTFLEFALKTRQPKEDPLKRMLSLYSTETTPEDPSTNGLESSNHAGYLEKNLSDFFDIQIFSTVYFGS